MKFPIASPPVCVRALLLLLFCAFALGVPTRAEARSAGISTEGCTGCHNGGKVPTVTITSDLATISPGSLLNLTVSISPSNGNAAGFYLEASTGTFSIVEAGTKLMGDGVVQSATRRGTGGDITFKVGWKAPATPGGVDFSAWGNSVNGDGRPSGDAEGMAFFSTAFGCTGTKFYRDYDNDGVGSESSGYSIRCVPEMFYSAKAGDCNDNDPRIFAGNAEICDGKDNNCDGKVDEGLPVVAYCTDADGDGHGVLGQTTMMGCGVSKGFGICDNDCNDKDPAVHAGAIEICNNKDDNCNDRVDENARVVCGVGWCAKYADNCGSTCTPGAPRAEECNDFDDDCDGVVDNGSDLQLCGKPGLTCNAGYCVAAGSGAAGGAPNGSAGGSSGTFGVAGRTGSSGGADPGSSDPSPVAAGSAGNGSPASDVEKSSGCGFARSPASQSLATAGLLVALAAWARRRRVRIR